MSKYIQQLIAEGEHQQLDFKFEISDARKIARTFSAFANTKGGRLLIGVRDNGSIAGVTTDEEAYMAEAAAHIYSKPMVPFSIKSWRIEQKTVLEVIIPESQSKPHKAPWKGEQYKAYYRHSDQNFVADAVMLEVWEIESKNKNVLVTFNVVEQTLFETLNTQQFISLRGFMKVAGIGYYKAKRTLANLVSIGSLEAFMIDEHTFFKLPDES